MLAIFEMSSVNIERFNGMTAQYNGSLEFFVDDPD